MVNTLAKALVALLLSFGVNAMQEEQGYEQQEQQSKPCKKLENYETPKIICTTNLGGIRTTKCIYNTVELKTTTTTNEYMVTSEYGSGEECQEEFPIDKRMPCEQVAQQKDQWHEEKSEDYSQQQKSLKKTSTMKTDVSKEEIPIKVIKRTVYENTDGTRYIVTEEVTERTENNWETYHEEYVKGEECQKTKECKKTKG